MLLISIFLLSKISVSPSLLYDHKQLLILFFGGVVFSCSTFSDFLFILQVGLQNPPCHSPSESLDQTQMILLIAHKPVLTYRTAFGTLDCFVCLFAFVLFSELLDQEPSEKQDKINGTKIVPLLLIKSKLGAVAQV